MSGMRRDQRECVLSYLGMTAAGMPLHLGGDSQFRAVREVMRAANYTEKAVCERLGIPAFTSFGAAEAGRRLAENLATPLDALIHLFLECEPAPREKLEAVFGAEGLGAFEDLGLLVSSEGSSIVSPVGLCPTRGLYLVSDRGGDLRTLAEDVVYPAILENTQHFLDTFPKGECGSFLDLGTGTGVAALLAAKTGAADAWACDITARAVHFTEFNRRLNDLPNVTVARGDLYEAVGDRRFDRIVTHPPYVPVAEPTCIFRDGGDDGEQIIRRAIEGLPRHLAPGGRFYALVLVSDREGAPAESRVRQWLGESGPEFDVVLITETAREPSDFIGRAMQKGTHRIDELQYWGSVFRRLRVEYLVYGCILIRRHSEASQPFTVRLQKGPQSGIAETEWAIGFHAAASAPGADEWLLASRPKPSAQLHLAVLHRVHDGVLTPREFMLKTRHPFESECKCPAWTAELVGQCDGRRTALELFETLAANGSISKDTRPGDFADILRVLIGSGFLEIEEFPVAQESVPV